MKKRKILPVLLAVLLGGVLWLLALNDAELGVTRYELTTDKLSADWKIALLSDLHSEERGEGNSRLIGEIREYGPDVILMCGDMVDAQTPKLEVALELCEALVEIADVYYIYGNHEGALQYGANGPQIPLDRYLTARGVQVLYGGVYTLSHGEDRISLFAKSIHGKDYREDPAIRTMAAEFLEQDCFKLVMSHYPDLIYDALKEEPFDLAVAGHYHGGQVILPGLGGLYHRETGFFPEYYGGAYPFRYGTLVLSRGLGNGTGYPRINNNPELVFIDVKST